MKVIATGKGYYQRRRRIGDEFELVSPEDFVAEWMAKAEDVEKAKASTRPLTLSEIGAAKADSFVAVMHRNRVVQPKDKSPQKPAAPSKRAETSLNS